MSVTIDVEQVRRAVRLLLEADLITEDGAYLMEHMLNEQVRRSA